MDNENEMTQCQKEKQDWVLDLLRPCLRSIDFEITDVDYQVVWSQDGKYYNEIVTVTFESGAQRKANVTGDSKLAILKDVVSQTLSE